MQCSLYSHFPFCQRLRTLTFLLVNYSYADHNSKKIPIQMLHNSISTLYLHINPLSSFLCCFSLICNLSQVLNHALCLCQLYYSISQLGFFQLYSTVAILQVHLYKACHLTLHIHTILYLYILLINHNLILS